MDTARVRDLATGNYLFNGQSVAFVRLPARGDRISAPSCGVVSVEGVLHSWTGTIPVADVVITPVGALAGQSREEHTDPAVS